MILSTAYLGNIQYYGKLVSGSAVIDLYENYQKQSYRNRCEILTANRVDSLIVPVCTPSGQKIPTKEVRIDNTKKWQHRHFQAIVSAYRGSPYFFHYEEEFAPCYRKRYEFLIDLNDELQEIVLRLLHTPMRPQYSDSYVEVRENPAANTAQRKQKEIPGTPSVRLFADPVEDFRQCISPKQHLRKPDPSFQQQPYYQVFAERFGFVPNLSILDLLCCEGPGALALLNGKKTSEQPGSSQCYSPAGN